MREPPRLLRALLRLYPRGHRRAYGAEMWDVVRYRFSRGGAGRRERVKRTATTAVDLLWSAALVWTKTMGGEAMDAMRGMRSELRYVGRVLLRSPGYALTAVGVLAAAVAVNVTVLGFVRGTLLYEAPYPDPGGVMAVWGSNPVDGQLRDVISGPNYVEMAREARSLQGMAAFHFDQTYLTGGATPEVVPAVEVSVDFLDVLGVRPALGRGFEEADRTSSAPATALVSHAFWRDRLDADPRAVGRVLDIEDVPHTILGVLPEGFQFLDAAPLYTPLRDDVLAADGRYRIHYNAVGRLAPGATPGDATRELTGIMERIAGDYPGFERWSVLVEPLHAVAVSAVRPVILTLAAVVGLVLLLALVNLGTLFRIRTLARRQELSVRMALGAGRLRVARVLGLEVGVLALSGAALGLAVTPFLLHRVTALVPPWVPIPGSAIRVPLLRAVLDPGVIGLALAASVGGALLLTVPGFLSALRAGATARGGRTHRSLRGTRLLVGVELALATVLCLAASLAARSAGHLLATEVGVEDRGLLTLWVGDVWDRSPEGQVAYYREIVGQVEGIPGVESAAMVDYVDFLAEDDYAGIELLDRSLQPTRDLREEWRRVSRGFFATAGMDMRAGRAFRAGDFEGTPRVAVVNEAFARKHYGADGAVGRFLSTHDEAYRELEIVGVVGDIRSLGPAEPAPPMLYVPNQGAPRGTVGMYVRVEGDPASYREAVQSAIWSVDPSQPVMGIRPMSELVGAWVAIPRATRALLSGLGVLALLLAAVGVFGVVSYAVRSSRSELGVRIALGASPARLERELLVGMAPLLVLGVGVGLAAGIVAARGARALFFGVGPLDPVALTVTVAAMSVAVLAALWVPARRAGATDPTEVIRSV